MEEKYDFLPANSYNCAGFALGTYDIPEFPTWNYETYNNLLNSKGAQKHSKFQRGLDGKTLNLIDSWFEKKFIKSLSNFGLTLIQTPKNHEELPIGAILVRFKRGVFQDFHFLRKIEVEGEACWGSKPGMKDFDILFDKEVFSPEWPNGYKGKIYTFIKK